jgi:hypothetical protein
MDPPPSPVDSQLPDIKPGLNLQDHSTPSQSSSRTLARKSKGDSARQSRTPGPKAWKDFMTDFHEATQIDQAQAQQEAQYHHVQQMARLELKKEKMRRKYEIETLKLQVQLAQVQAQQQHQA